MKTFGKLGDKLLSALVPASTAAAVCPPDCIQERQKSDGRCRYRTCCYRGVPCTWTCGTWSGWGACTS
ncbi:hypothetical protein AB0I28_24755 [Phytomonospora sp. NPDC050363]|uniref:hypothetical protein n=1 Tax=Phytomonospora sp. NPDC050363 TaxID=3155642 RepID=UPI0033F68655